MDTLIQFDEVDEHGPQRRSATYDFAASEIAGGELTRIGPVRIDVEVSPGDGEGEYAAKGSVEYAADLTCARCLDPYPVATLSPFAVRFRPRPAATAFDKDQEIEITGEDLDVEHYTERAVSLRELAAEQIHLSLPMKPLCDEKCLGLCPSCGTNLNRESCSCGEQPGDERWGALREIRDQLARKKEI
jgi:uncharacterized protein